MNFGLGSLATFGFLGVGFWVVITVGVGLCLVYVVGPARGKRAAERWISLCLAVLAIGGIGTLTWAVLSGQWQRFMLTFGFGPLGEMLMLATLFLGTLWFMALRYTQDLKDD